MSYEYTKYFAEFRNKLSYIRRILSLKNCDDSIYSTFFKVYIITK